MSFIQNEELISVFTVCYIGGPGIKNTNSKRCCYKIIHNKQIVEAGVFVSWSQKQNNYGLRILVFSS